MNSLIKLPMRDHPVSILEKYNINIENSIFDLFNSCGAVLSNSEDLNIKNGLTTP